MFHVCQDKRQTGPAIFDDRYVLPTGIYTARQDDHPGHDGQKDTRKLPFSGLFNHQGT